MDGGGVASGGMVVEFSIRVRVCSFGTSLVSSLLRSDGSDCGGLWGSEQGGEGAT